LQQNDIVFVDMRKGKVNTQNQAWVQNITLGLSLLTGFSFLINLFR
jgi:hypothetical protein